MRDSDDGQQIDFTAEWVGRPRSTDAHLPARVTITNRLRYPLAIIDFRFEDPRLEPPYSAGVAFPEGVSVMNADAVIPPGETRSWEAPVHFTGGNVERRAGIPKVSLSFRDEHGHLWRKWCAPHNWYAPDEKWQ
jgi:hypothetical protein